MIDKQNDSIMEIDFRINDKKIKNFLDTSPYDKKSTIKYLIRISLINNRNIIETFEDNGEERDRIKNTNSHVYIKFSKEDEDLIHLLNNYNFSKQTLIKRLMRIALINDQELIQKSGLVPLNQLDKQVINKDQKSDSTSNATPDNQGHNENRRIGLKTKGKFGNLGKEY